MHVSLAKNTRRKKEKRKQSTESVDNYLKAILTLSSFQGPSVAEESRVTGNALAAALNVAPASVTNMLQKLAAAPHSLVKYQRHHGVLLSKAGRRRALEVIRHHRLIETFLYEVLDYPIEELHEEAERLEHFISERFEERIAARLGHPTVDPHGHSIPTLAGEMPRQSSIPLTEAILDEGEARTFIVDSVSDRHAPTLRSLKNCGMIPGAKLRVAKTSARKSDQPCYSVRIGRSAAPLDLPPQMAREIWVLPAK